MDRSGNLATEELKMDEKWIIVNEEVRRPGAFWEEPVQTRNYRDHRDAHSLLCNFCKAASRQLTLN